MKEKQRYEKLVRFIYFDSLWINYKSIFVNINKFVDAFWVEQTKLSQSLVFAPLIHCSLYRIYKTYVNNVQRLFGEKTMQRTSFYWKSCEHKIVLSGNLVLDIFHQTKYVCFFLVETLLQIRISSLWSNNKMHRVISGFIEIPHKIIAATKELINILMAKLW